MLLFQVNNEFEMTDFVQTIKLPTVFSKVLNPGDMCSVAGWGKLHEVSSVELTNQPVNKLSTSQHDSLFTTKLLT
jgi:hypothetical protein